MSIMPGDHDEGFDFPPVQLGYCVPLTTPEAENNGEDADSEPTQVAHESANWSNWDGGKVGGKPSWLNPQRIPSREELHCPTCVKTGGGDNEAAPMRFVAQLYCPADDEADNHNAFHRSLYVFACPNAVHQGRSRSKEVTDSNIEARHCGGVKVLRCQLPQSNPYFPPSCKGRSDSFFEQWNKHHPQTWNVNACAVCGLSANGKCPVQEKYFCGQVHQKEHMKYNHKSKMPGVLPSLLTEFVLVVEEEPGEGECSNTDESQQIEIMKEAQANTLFAKDGNDNDDAALEQSDLNTILAGGEGGDPSAAHKGVTDSQTIEFYSRIQIGGKATASQCLRYCRWPPDPEDGQDDISAPLWISSDCTPSSKEDISCCPSCGGERAFEFQIMPQMLHYLLEGSKSETKAGGTITKEAKEATVAAATILEKECPDTNNEEAKAMVNAKLQQMEKEVLSGTDSLMDWGTIAVYTCVNSCDAANASLNSQAAYVEEFAWRQPVLDR
jgi:pre-rRNA-processing protein TSR4